MTRNYYLPQDESGRAQLLEHLAHHLPAYIDTLELSDTDLEELRAAAKIQTLPPYRLPASRTKEPVTDH